MEEVAGAARSALGEVRMAVSGMHGASLSLELDRASRALAAAGIAAELPSALPALDPDWEPVLAMALREAVTNVIRHAGARVCRISLKAEADGMLSLRVEDDGVGSLVLEGAGLSGMRTRLVAAGGTMQIESRIGGQVTGTVLLARLPPLRRPARTGHAIQNETAPTATAST
jgi:two-component system sensor histidine kinase DesK